MSAYTASPRLHAEPLPPPLIQTPEGGTRLKPSPCDSEFTCTGEKRVTVTPCRRPERLCKDLTASNTAKGTAGRGSGIEELCVSGWGLGSGNVSAVVETGVFTLGRACNYYFWVLNFFRNVSNET